MSLKRLMVIFIFLFSANFSFASLTVFDDGEHWPFPWGTECPFPWETISLNDWSFKLNDKKVHVSFYSNPMTDNTMNLVTIAYGEDSKLVAFASEDYILDQNVLIVHLKDLTTDDNRLFTILLRVYDDRLRVLPDDGERRFSSKPINNQKFCNDNQLKKLAVTVTRTNGCSLCPVPQLKHQIAEKIEKD